jgi:hypothetical protein
MSFNLPNKEVISIVKRYHTDGHSPYLVITSDYERYVLKAPNNSFDLDSLIKEFLCSWLLKKWGVNTPEIAALTLAKELATSPEISGDNRFSYSSVYFGSKHMQDALDLQSLISIEGKVAARKIINLNDIFKVALFDIWVENDDRKPTNNNILLCPSTKGSELTPIDHAATFSTLSFDDLNPIYLSFSDNDSIAYSGFGRSIIKKSNINKIWMDNAREMFYLCIAKCEGNFQEIYDKIPEQLGFSDMKSEKLKTFLFNKERNKKVFDQFTYIINNISK